MWQGTSASGSGVCNWESLVGHVWKLDLVQLPFLRFLWLELGSEASREGALIRAIRAIRVSPPGPCFVTTDCTNKEGDRLSVSVPKRGLPFALWVRPVADLVFEANQDHGGIRASTGHRPVLQMPPARLNTYGPGHF
jgi:hypothetical protein